MYESFSVSFEPMRVSGVLLAEIPLESLGEIHPGLVGHGREHPQQVGELVG